MSNVTAAQLAVEAARALLLAALPAEVITKNLTRAVSLTTPVAGPWTIPVGGSISITLDGTTFTACPLTVGLQAAAQLVIDINAAMGATVASVTTDGRMRITGTAPAAPATNSAIGIQADETGAAAALGFDASGELISRAPIVAPSNKGVMDGEPQVLDPWAAGKMLVVFRDREDVEVQFRRDERVATMELLVYVPLVTQNYHRDREEIQAACACICNVLATTAGRQFATTPGDGNGVGFTTVKSVKVAGSSWGLKNDVNFLMDIARLVVTARVFQRAVL